MNEIENGEKRTEIARSRLHQLENRLRVFVRDKIGEDNKRIDKSFVKNWESSRKKEKIPPRKPLEFDLIYYSTFDQLKKIIIQNENWSQIFQKHFGRPDGIISRLNELDSIRDTIAHNRILSDIDFRSFMMLYEQINRYLEDSTNLGKTEQEQIRKTKIDISPTKKRKLEEKVVTSLSGEKETRKVILLPNTADITQLNIDDDLLDSLYEEARQKAIDIYDDAKFSYFCILVYPFQEVGGKVSIYLHFYSKSADRIRCFSYSDVFPQMKHMPPDRRAKFDSNRQVFRTSPWKTSPKWMQFLKREYAKIGRFAPASYTNYILSAYPNRKTHWTLKFSDDFSGNEYTIQWDGKN